MVLKTPLKKHRTSAMTKTEGTISNEQRKSSLMKKSRSPVKIGSKKNDPKVKSSNLKTAKILKSASVTKKTGEISKIPVPLSKSSTYKQVTVQKQKMKTNQKKKVVDSSQSSKQQVNPVSNAVPPNKADVNYVMMPKEKSTPNLEKYNQSDVAARVKQMKKSDANNQKRIKHQYMSSVLADIHKTDLETTLRKYASGHENNVRSTESKKQKRKSLKKKTLRISPQIVSKNNDNTEFSSINLMRKDTPSMTTHFLDAESQSSQIPVTKKHYKLVKQKKSPRAKQNFDGKDTKSTQLTQHKKKSKSHTLKLNRVQSSDSVPNLPIREIKHNDSFVLSAKKLENSSSVKRTTRYKKSPEHLKLKTKRPKSDHQAAIKIAEPKSDSTKPEQLKSCLKKTWDENDFTAVNTKYEMNFGFVPLIVN